MDTLMENQIVYTGRVEHELCLSNTESLVLLHLERSSCDGSSEKIYSYCVSIVVHRPNKPIVFEFSEIVSPLKSRAAFSKRAMLGGLKAREYNDKKNKINLTFETVKLIS